MANRPKGYAAWDPSDEVRVVLSQCMEIFREYQEHLPLTVRQIFYRLVGQYGYEKTERAYKRLANYLVRARRAKLIPFRYIRDDGVDIYSGDGGFQQAGQFWPDVYDAAEGFTLDRDLDQPYDIEVWCEAGGIAPMLAQVVAKYGIRTFSTGGFSSVTATHGIARRVIGNERPTKFLQLGDYDPSGQSIFESMDEDVWAFVVGGGGNSADWEAVRVAITPDQIQEHGIPTAPPKSTDSRSRNWFDETCQLEAMPPNLITEILEERVRDLMDMDVWEETVERERDIQSKLTDQVQRAMDELEDEE